MLALTINYIDMIDMTTGWAMAMAGTSGQTANHVFRTEDGGATWRDVSPVMEEDYHGFLFPDAQLAWIWSRDGERSWRTQNAGQKWSALEDPPTPRPHRTWFNDSQHGWRIGVEGWERSLNGMYVDYLETTQDGGQTWQEMNPPPGNGVVFIAFPDAQTAWALRAWVEVIDYDMPNLVVPFLVQTTSDGGKTWTSQNMPLPPEADQVNDGYGSTYLAGAGICGFVAPVYSSSAIWKLALTCGTRGWMYTTVNQGKTWIINSLPQGGYITEIEFADPTNGWLLSQDLVDLSQSILYHSTNGGQSWALLKRTQWAYAQLNFLDAQSGWAVAFACSDADCIEYEYDSGLAETALLRTIDAGRTWELIEPQLAQ